MGVSCFICLVICILPSTESFPYKTHPGIQDTIPAAKAVSLCSGLLYKNAQKLTQNK